jgi:hypothetical protein
LPVNIFGFDKAVMRVRRYVARLSVVLICLTGSAMLAVAPAAAAPGFAAQFSDLPQRFTAGAGAATVSAVASRTADGDCVKVRWSLVLRLGDIRLDQVRVDRVEEGGSFPVEVRTQNGVTRLTDTQLDPGSLCRDRTVTARYQIAFGADVADGRITLTTEAFDANQRLLASRSATTSVVGGRGRPATPATTAAKPTPTPAATEPTVPADEPAVTDLSVTESPAVAGAGAGTGRADRASAGGGLGIVQAGFLLGALLLFLGVGLLLRLRILVRTAPAADEPVADGGWSAAPQWSGTHSRSAAGNRRRRTVRR